MSPHLLDDVDQAAPVRQMRGEQKVIRTSIRDLDDARVSVDQDRPPVHAIRDVFDARDRSRGQVAEHRGEVERAGKAEPEAQPAVGHQSVGRTPPGAELARGGPEDVGDGAVELAEAAEARGERDLRDGKIGVIEQPPGEVRPARARKLGGSDPDLVRRRAGAGGEPRARGVAPRRPRCHPAVRRRRRGGSRGRPPRMPRCRPAPSRDMDGIAGMPETRRPLPRPRDRSGARWPGFGRAEHPGRQ